MDRENCADDFMAQYSGGGFGASASVGVEVRRTDGAGFNLNENFTW